MPSAQMFVSPRLGSLAHHQQRELQTDNPSACLINWFLI
jgi:hypothetical protein